MIGIVLGFLCLICTVLLSGKVITRKLNLIKADRLFRKLHSWLTVAIVALLPLHFFLIFPVMKSRNPVILLTGMAAAAIIFLMIFQYHIMKTDHRKRLRWHRILSVVVLLLAGSHLILNFMDYQAYQFKIQNVHLQEIDTSDIPDGQYQGTYDAGYIYAKVNVHISDGSIKEIDILEHRNERGSAAEQIAQNITDTQQFPVDAVSGATNSSKVIQQAVQNALTNAFAR